MERPGCCFAEITFTQAIQDLPSIHQVRTCATLGISYIQHWPSFKSSDEHEQSGIYADQNFLSVSHLSKFRFTIAFKSQISSYCASTVSPSTNAITCGVAFNVANRAWECKWYPQRQHPQSPVRVGRRLRSPPSTITKRIKLLFPVISQISGC